MYYCSAKPDGFGLRVGATAVTSEWEALAKYTTTRVVPDVHLVIQEYPGNV